MEYSLEEYSFESFLHNLKGSTLTALSCCAICLSVIVGCLERFGCDREDAAEREAAADAAAASGAELEVTVGNM